MLGTVVETQLYSSIVHFIVFFFFKRAKTKFMLLEKKFTVVSKYREPMSIPVVSEFLGTFER